MGEWRFRREYLCELVATTDRDPGYDLVAGEVPPTRRRTLPWAAQPTRPGTDTDVELPFRAAT